MERLLEDVPVPEPGSGEALIEVAACGLGATVLKAIEGGRERYPAILPFVPGHEIVGRVVSLGPGVSRPAPGTRVMVSYYVTCGECRFCQQGRETLCEHLRGYVGRHFDGGYAEYAALPVANLLPIPNGIDDVEATTIPDAIDTPFHVCYSPSRVSPGQRVMVIGAAGGVGVHMVQMARVFGATVIGVDLDDERLACLDEYGAEDTLNFECRHKAALDAPVDVAVDFVCTRETLGFCRDQLAPGGTLVVMVGRQREAEPPLALSSFVANEKIVMGSRYTSRWELERAIGLVASGRMRPVVSEACSLEGVAALFEKLRARKLFGRGAVITRL
jgi:propanol-preferring alcohol dehydrogenase